MYCSKCGQKIDDNDMFCSLCGIKLHNPIITSSNFTNIPPVTINNNDFMEKLKFISDVYILEYMLKKQINDLKQEIKDKTIDTCKFLAAYDTSKLPGPGCVYDNLCTYGFDNKFMPDFIRGKISDTFFSIFCDKLANGEQVETKYNIPIFNDYPVFSTVEVWNSHPKFIKHYKFQEFKKRFFLILNLILIVGCLLTIPIPGFPTLFVGIIIGIIAFINYYAFIEDYNDLSLGELYKATFEVMKSKAANYWLQVANEKNNLIQYLSNQVDKVSEIEANFYKKENLIHEKYRNMVATTQIYEYFETGRCNKLDGPDGAYNLFEHELQLKRITYTIEKANEEQKECMNNIFNKLSTMSTSTSYEYITNSYSTYY